MVLRQSRCFQEAQQRLHNHFVSRFPPNASALAPKKSVASTSEPMVAQVDPSMHVEAARQRVRARFLAKFEGGTAVSPAGAKYPAAALRARRAEELPHVEAARQRLRSRSLARGPESVELPESVDLLLSSSTTNTALSLGDCAWMTAPARSATTQQLALAAPPHPVSFRETPVGRLRASA